MWGMSYLKQNHKRKPRPVKALTGLGSREDRVDEEPGR
jgi:hypothetical protein